MVDHYPTLIIEDQKTKTVDTYPKRPTRKDQRNDDKRHTQLTTAYSTSYPRLMLTRIYYYKTSLRSIDDHKRFKTVDTYPKPIQEKINAMMINDIHS